MKYTICCSPSENSRALNFFLCTGSQNIFLFTQRFRAAVYRHFARPLSAEKALSFGNTRNKSVQNTIERLRSYKGFVKLEYGIDLLQPKNCTPYIRKQGRISEYAA